MLRDHYADARFIRDPSFGLPLAEEERRRFDVVTGRRADTLATDGERHLFADRQRLTLADEARRLAEERADRRNAYVRDNAPFLRPRGVSVVYGSDPVGRRDVHAFGIPIYVVPSANAAGFAYQPRHFESSDAMRRYNHEASALPLREEERMRFESVMLRRQALEPYEARSHADARRGALLTDRVGALKAREARHERYLYAKGGLAKLREEAPGTPTTTLTMTTTRYSPSLLWTTCGRLGCPKRSPPRRTRTGLRRPAATLTPSRTPTSLRTYNTNWNALALAEEEAIRFTPLASRRASVGQSHEQAHADADGRRRAMLAERARQSSRQTERAAKARQVRKSAVGGAKRAAKNKSLSSPLPAVTSRNGRRAPFADMFDEEQHDWALMLTSNSAADPPPLLLLIMF